MRLTVLYWPRTCVSLRETSTAESPYEYPPCSITPHSSHARLDTTVSVFRDQSEHIPIPFGWVEGAVRNTWGQYLFSHVPRRYFSEPSALSSVNLSDQHGRRAEAYVNSDTHCISHLATLRGPTDSDVPGAWRRVRTVCFSLIALETGVRPTQTAHTPARDRGEGPT